MKNDAAHFLPVGQKGSNVARGAGAGPLASPYHELFCADLGFGSHGASLLPCATPVGVGAALVRQVGSKTLCSVFSQKPQHIPVWTISP